MDEAKERGSKEALTIEDAETEILKLSRQATLERWTKDHYTREVLKVIEETRKNSTLGEKIEKPLKDYATKVLAQNKRILSYQATFFAMLLLMNEPTEWAEKELGEIRKSEGFTRLVNKELSNPTENIWKTGLPREEWHHTYMAAVKDLYHNLVSENAQQDYDTNVSLRNIAEMTVRYEYQTDMIRRLRKSDTKLVWIEPHANCSKRCEKYQGLLYSLDGTEGDIDGIHYRPLEYATNNPADRYTTKAGVTYQNGCITGFNCRHRLIPYNGEKIEEIPAKEVEKYRAINDKQRDFERKIRYCKKQAIEQQGTPKGAKYRKMAKELNEKYKAFSEKNDVAYYPDRTKIL